MLVSTLVTFISLLAVASAQATTTASIAGGTNGYSYAGCWNETTSVAGTNGVRALSGGKMESNDTATVSSCLAYCGASNYQYAGLEYAQECWCSNYISSFSTELNESSCALACKGNTSEICGGYLTFTLYNLTSKSSGASSSSAKGAASSVGASGWMHVIGAGAMALTFGAAL